MQLLNDVDQAHTAREPVAGRGPEAAYNVRTAHSRETRWN